MESHLLQMRGLKRHATRNSIIYTGSHLLQMRGLKHRKRFITVKEISRIFYRCVD